MVTASVSLSPIVVALSVAENQVQQRISTKILTDQIKQEAELVSKIVNGVTTANGESRINARTAQIINFRV